MYSFYITPEIEKVITKLQQPLFSMKDLNLTYRAINHYQSKGIITDRRSNRKLWRKFNGIEFIWIWIISQLRLIGVRLEDICKLEKKIFVEGELGYVDKANFINKSFVQEIASSIHGKYKLYMILFADMSFTFHDSLSTQQWLNKTYKDEMHISIPLDEPIKEVWQELKQKIPFRNSG
jgi:DNA-binding transcriptional MerR regulator